MKTRIPELTQAESHRHGGVACLNQYTEYLKMKTRQIILTVALIALLVGALLLSACTQVTAVTMAVPTQPSPPTLTVEVKSTEPANTAWPTKPPITTTEPAH